MFWSGRVMRIFFFLSLSFILFQFLPFGQAPPEPEEPASPVKGWWMVSYFAVSPTQYSTAGKGIIKAVSLGTRSSLFKKVKEKEKDSSFLSWRWKISNVVHSAIETRKDRFDTAARVMVIFGTEGGFSLFGGGVPSGSRIEYIWGSRVAAGQVFDHPGERNCKVFVLESGDRRAGHWVEERRNIHKDFKTAFGEDPPELVAVGIETDTDHSNEGVTAYYSDPRLTMK
jgi:hypothetical protein